MLRTSLFFALATTAACSFGDDRPLGPAGDAGPDGGSMDGPVVEEGHLLITEVKSSTGTNEFIEIWNPTNRDINLSNYYLSDFGDYWRYPSVTAPLTATGADFVVRFPDGAMLRSKQVIVVSTRAATGPANASYALDLEAEQGAIKAFRNRLVQNTQLPNITDGQGEVVVLFYWDGMSDLVKDVDIVIAGTAPQNENALAAKQPVDGPDPDTTATPYKPEAMQLGVMMEATSPTTSYKRITLESGAETQTGAGNGITGDDETSEQISRSWDGAAPTAPTPGEIPANLR